MDYSDLFACHFGGAPKPKGESPEARTARVEQRAKQGLDARALRLRKQRQLKGREASSLLGGGEGSLLGSGL